jgi:histidinol-phosphate aminotransferase
VTPTIPFVRPELARPAPYRWQENVPPGSPSRFDMNTLPLSPAYWPEIAARVAQLESCSYPEAVYQPLREAIGRYCAVDWHQVIPTAGCDEALLLCAALSAGRGDTAIVAKPTYQMYGVATATAGATLDTLAPHDDLRLDLDGLFERAPSSRLVWLCSPNNPTAEQVPESLISDLCRVCPGLVVVDQAYLEFGGTDLVPLVGHHENLVVCRTFSKGWGLASLRVGYAVAAPAVAGALDSLRPPGSLSLQSAAAVELALSHADAMRSDCAGYVAERGRLRRAIETLGLPIIGEAGPFVCFRVPMPSEDAFTALAGDGLVIRTFGHDPTLAGVVRTSVATPPENDALVAGLARLVGRDAPTPEPVASNHASLWGRRGTVARATRETTIAARVVVDGHGHSSVRTGIGFLDHMLTTLAFHAMFDLDLDCDGDLHVDTHHTVEDVGIALGQALDRALGERTGIRRFGDAAAPLDEAIATCVVDLGGRGVSAIDLHLHDETTGAVPTSLWPHMLDSFARAGRVNLHLTARGADDHHIVEAAFKALARALRTACETDPRRAAQLPSTKGAI